MNYYESESEIKNLSHTIEAWDIDRHIPKAYYTDQHQDDTYTPMVFAIYGGVDTANDDGDGDGDDDDNYIYLSGYRESTSGGFVIDESCDFDNKFEAADSADHCANTAAEAAFEYSATSQAEYLIDENRLALRRLGIDIMDFYRELKINTNNTKAMQGINLTIAHLKKERKEALKTIVYLKADHRSWVY